MSMLPLQGFVVEESQEDDEYNLTSITWQQIAENSTNFIIFENVIEEFHVVEPNGENNLPDQLLEVANTILYISFGIKSVKSHKKDFERLLGQATSLVVVFWHLYVQEGIPGSMWPPPYLRGVINKLVDTVYFIHKFMKRKSREGLAKRTLVGYFGLRDFGKFEKYQRKLESVALGFESAPNNVNINKVLLEILKDRVQHPIEDGDEDGDNQQSEEAVRKKKITKRQPEARSASKATKGTNLDKKSETKGNRTRYQDPDEDVDEGTSRQGSRANNAAKSKMKKAASLVDDDEDDYESMYADEEHHEEIPIDDLPAPKEQLKKKSVSTPKQKVKSTPVSVAPQDPTSLNTGMEKNSYRRSARKGSRSNNAARSKTDKRASPVYDDDDEEDEAEISDVEPVAPKPQSKKKARPSPTPKQKVNSAPVSPQVSNTFSNVSGNMINHNVGNVYSSVIEDAFNDNSVNYGRRKPA